MKKESSFFKLCSDRTNYWIMQRDDKNPIKYTTVGGYRMCFRGRPFNFWGGCWVILKKKILQVHMHKKKFLHKTIVPKKIHARTVSWKKNSGKIFLELTHWTLSISRLLKDFSIWTWVLINERFVAQYCVFLGAFICTLIAPVISNICTFFCWIQITAGVGI